MTICDNCRHSLPGAGPMACELSVSALQAEPETCGSFEPRPVIVELVNTWRAPWFKPVEVEK